MYIYSDTYLTFIKYNILINQAAMKHRGNDFHYVIPFGAALGGCDRIPDKRSGGPNTGAPGKWGLTFIYKMLGSEITGSNRAFFGIPSGKTKNDEKIHHS